MKIYYEGITFDSELEVDYYKSLKENNVRFLYQNEYKNNPIHINLGRRKNYTPDFVTINDEVKVITIIEMKGYAKWTANEDNNIMDFMINKVNTDVGFLTSWLAEIGVDTRGYDIKYQRLKYLKGIGFVDYYYKNPNSLSNKRKQKIEEQNVEIKELREYKKNVERYFSYLKKNKLTKQQLDWKKNFESENNLL